jgi:two-component sensor histidine kinase
MTFRTPAAFVWLFLTFTAIGVFFALHSYLDEGPGASLAVHFYYELTGAWAAMVWVPALGWLTRVAPFTRNTIARALGLNALGALVYTLLHSTAELAMRFPLQSLVGFHYPLSDMARATYISEAPSDLVYYAFIVTSLYLLRHFLASRDLEAKLAEAKLENLRLQLQPHFLFNTLNAISSVMYEDVEKADAMLAKLSDFLRTVLDSGSVHTVPLDKELAVENMYVDIMTTRLECNLTLDVRVDEDAKDSSVPFMLLQPLLENSIRHGMGSSRKTLDLGIEVSRSNGSTIIDVDDNGLGIEPNAARGIGLTNVASRLKYMYGDAATFSIAPLAAGGTRATLTFPYTPGERTCP